MTCANCGDRGWMRVDAVGIDRDGNGCIKRRWMRCYHCNAAERREWRAVVALLGVTLAFAAFLLVLAVLT